MTRGLRREAKLLLATLPLAAMALLAGCAQQYPRIEIPPAAADAPMTFDDLAAVFSQVLDERGQIDPTALAVHLPRLDRQLALLARPWPQDVATGQSDQRLAWLYNARAAWSLRIVAGELRPLDGRRDAFDLPETIDSSRLMGTPFPLNGREMTLSAIDEELTAWGDFRLAALAPDATDLAGPLPAKPFTAENARQSLAERFGELLADPRRLVVDHDYQVVRVPPAIWRARQGILMEYNYRRSTAQADLLAALRSYVAAPARGRLADAAGYRVEVHRGPAAISTVRLDWQGRLRRFGPAGN